MEEKSDCDGRNNGTTMEAHHEKSPKKTSTMTTMATVTLRREMMMRPISAFCATVQ